MKPLRILNYGYIDLNLLDGSAVFLSAITTMMSSMPNTEVDVVLARPIQRDTIIQPLLEVPNVSFIDPFADEKWKLEPQQKLTIDQSATILAHYWEKQHYDVLFIRSMDVAHELRRVAPHILAKAFVYVTGITSATQILSDEELRDLQALYDASLYFVCQTEEMKQYIVRALRITEDEDRMIVLNPLVPNTDVTVQHIERKHGGKKVVYTGKFAHGWNSVPMMTLFKYVRRRYDDIELHVAGDKFNHEEQHEKYKQTIRYLLGNTEGLTWYGGLPREEAQQLIRNCDIGLTWRTTEMDDSLELSTKLLEYGSLGKPVIMNPTPMHVRLYGADYPFYAKTDDEFIGALRRAIEDEEAYLYGARRAYEVSSQFTFTHGTKLLRPYLYTSRIVSELQSYDVQPLESVNVTESFSHHLQNVWKKQGGLLTKSEAQPLLQWTNDEATPFQIIEMKQRAYSY